MATYTSTTDASGLADFGYIPVGTYTLTQTVAVNGYNVTSTQPVTVDSTTKNLTMTNAPTSPKTLTITKVDGSGAAVAGAKFKLYDSTGTIELAESEATTTIDNIIQFTNLASTVTGVAYQYKESQVPAHYHANENLVPISVTDNIATNVVNTLFEGAVALTLDDANYSALKLPNATFTLSN